MIQCTANKQDFVGTLFGNTRMQSDHPCFTKGVITAIVLSYAAAGAILTWQVGLWEMVRHVLVNGVIVFAWLWSARAILRDTPVPESELIRHTAFELGWFLAGLALSVGLAANAYAGWLPLPRWLYYLAIYGTGIILFLTQRYSPRSLGLTWPSRRGSASGAKRANSSMPAYAREAKFRRRIWAKISVAITARHAIDTYSQAWAVLPMRLVGDADGVMVAPVLSSCGNRRRPAGHSGRPCTPNFNRRPT